MFLQSFHFSKLAINRIVPALILLVLLVIGARLYQDYNISSDEQVERTNGIVSLTYLADQFGIARLQQDPIIQSYRHIPKLHDYMDRDYPVGFNLPMAIIERCFGINDDRDVFYLRHLLTYCVFIVGVISVYFLSARRFSSWKMGLLSASFLIISPRFFAEAFYNSKDIVFMSFFALATATAISYLLRPKIQSAVWHALACALAMDIRIMAVILPLMTLAFLGVRVLKREVAIKAAWQSALVYIGLMMLAVLLTWPWLWENPLSHFTQAFANMAKFRWSGQMLFNGNLIVSTQLPWNYLPVWILVTTPLLYSVLFAVGAFLVIARLLQRGFHFWRGEQELQDVIFLSLFFAPVTAVMVLHSVLYDSWRQMYFIYPAFLLLASRGFNSIWSWGISMREVSGRTIRVGLMLITSFSLASSLHWMIQAHPFQNVYFNFLVKENWKTRFDLDYWGLANRQALEWILGNEKKSYINVWQGSLSNVALSLKMLPKNQRERIGIVDRPQDADYILTNFRLNQTDYAKLTDFAGGRFELAHDILVGNEVIESIYRKTAEAASYQALPRESLWDFRNAKGASEAMLLRGGGWAKPEQWGVWSTGSFAKLVLPYPSHHPKTLALNLQAFISPASPSQLVQITVNQGEPQDFVLNEANNKPVIVQLPEMTSSWVTIHFYFPNAIIPKEHGLGADDRKLAIGLVSAAFR